jgi:hypothetical protein
MNSEPSQKEVATAICIGDYGEKMKQLRVNLTDDLQLKWNAL